MKHLTSRLLFVLVTVLSLTCTASLAFAETTDGITIGISRVVTSRVLKEDRKVYIYLPESYEQSRVTVDILSCTCETAASSSTRSLALSNT